MSVDTDDIPAFLRRTSSTSTPEENPVSVLHQFVQEVEASADVTENVVSFRKARAERIKELSVQWSDNTIQLGNELKTVRDTFPAKNPDNSKASRPGWHDWVRANLEFTPDHAAKLIRIADTFGATAPGGTITGSAALLSFLARDTVPVSVREEVAERIGRGENVGRGTAQKIAKEHAAPPAAEARKIAAETGKPTLARDGNIYLGATKEQEKEAEDRRTIVYGVRRAVETLAEMQMNGTAFIAYAFKHQLWKPEEEHLLTEARDWLTDLVEAWETR